MFDGLASYSYGCRQNWRVADELPVLARLKPVAVAAAPTNQVFAGQGSRSFTFALTSSVHFVVTEANFEALRERQSRHRTWSVKATPVTLPEDGVTGTSKG
ncbi:hypothetical protein WDL1P1_00339 (plasmid) [Variovorax sp. WDL1]|nr:hypothetical protein WDL1P1_00339 [Variovorax sp. WDL1]